MALLIGTIGLSGLVGCAGPSPSAPTGAAAARRVLLPTGEVSIPMESEPCTDDDDARPGEIPGALPHTN